jgi:hypothetical protein
MKIRVQKFSTDFDARCYLLFFTEKLAPFSTWEKDSFFILLNKLSNLNELNQGDFSYIRARKIAERLDFGVCRNVSLSQGCEDS